MQLFGAQHFRIADDALLHHMLVFALIVINRVQIVDRGQHQRRTLFAQQRLERVVDDIQIALDTFLVVKVSGAGPEDASRRRRTTRTEIAVRSSSKFRSDSNVQAPGPGEKSLDGIGSGGTTAALINRTDGAPLDRAAPSAE
jgi:hypothetical protein